MRAAAITALTGPDAVTVLDRPEPTAASDQVVIDIRYAGVAFPDVLQTRGEYQRRPELPFTRGGRCPASSERTRPASGPGTGWRR